MAKVAVIVPAAGAGRRFGGKENKIFQRLGKAPVFMRTLEAFANRDDVCQIQMVVSAEDMATISERFAGPLGFMGVKLVQGGSVRTESVRNALKTVNEQADLVCVHDAVRPCVAQEWIDAVFERAARTGAAILAYPVHGTLWKVGDAQDEPQSDTNSVAAALGLPAPPKPAAPKKLLATVDREALWEAQTPQVFARELLLRAYAQQGEATDDAAMVRRLGVDVHAVPGDARNVKITTARDLAFAAAIINTLPKPKPAGGLHPFDEGQW
ncbi:MAG: 2-C-methyl-D-erythritol 4-phosphate cytidylyltransferase [Planctomycetes bacterium ADurb.Bin126]|nr:MAG: 2-C-methyl-D-erythritol 4-phosphate cytidylyltransferase [Planctomycetes bacterium ADurb.Bin126]HOD84395.1 IspD/TarI family cytidylyltransferase [Phycisphaerae bacterium]HQL75630.1 IspD/TarI family cytidylyltransferase [Phycisphaerae bacterium]